MVSDQFFIALNFFQFCLIPLGLSVKQPLSAFAMCKPERIDKLSGKGQIAILKWLEIGQVLRCFSTASRMISWHVTLMRR